MQKTRVIFLCMLMFFSGHMLDPDELPGLAHFCEHMLFLGTKKVIHLQPVFNMFLQPEAELLNGAELRK